MRYFRCAAFSASASVLFALLEIASLPHFPVLRRVIQQEAASAGPRTKRTIDFCLDSKIRPEDQLLAWNSDTLDVVKKVKSCFLRYFDELRGQQ